MTHHQKSRPRRTRSLGPLYDAIENGVADPSDPMLKDRIGELKATRDQARIDAERAEDAIDRAGPTTRHRPSRRLPGQPASACGPMAAATAAIISARSPNASKSIRKNCASWDRKACSCARWSPLKAQKRRVLACPALYRSGAPDEIRTHDLCLRRAALYPAELRVPDLRHGPRGQRKVTHRRASWQTRCGAPLWRAPLAAGQSTAAGAAAARARPGAPRTIVAYWSAPDGSGAPRAVIQLAMSPTTTAASRSRISMW